MHTSTKEFRPQSLKELLSKDIWRWHTQYAQSRSPFSRTQAPQIACYLAVTPLSGAMGYSDLDCQSWTNISIEFSSFCFNCVRSHWDQPIFTRVECYIKIWQDIAEISLFLHEFMTLYCFLGGLKSMPKLWGKRDLKFATQQTPALKTMRVRTRLRWRTRMEFGCLWRPFLRMEQTRADMSTSARTSSASPDVSTRGSKPLSKR